MGVCGGVCVTRSIFKGVWGPQTRQSWTVAISGSQTSSVLLAVFLNFHLVINILEFRDFLFKKSALLVSPENLKM